MPFFLIIKDGLYAEEFFRFQSSMPMQGFLMPFFNEAGVTTWLCSGEQVQYLSSEKVKMQKMCITFFQPHHPNTIDLVIRSDDAVISIPHYRAYGESLVTATSASYTILGEKWIWEGKCKGKTFSKVFIKKNANVMFYD